MHSTSLQNVQPAAAGAGSSQQDVDAVRSWLGRWHGAAVLLRPLRLGSPCPGACSWMAGKCGRLLQIMLGVLCWGARRKMGLPSARFARLPQLQPPGLRCAWLSCVLYRRCRPASLTSWTHGKRRHSADYSIDTVLQAEVCVQRTVQAGSSLGCGRAGFGAS